LLFIDAAEVFVSCVARHVTLTDGGDVASSTSVTFKHRISTYVAVPDMLLWRNEARQVKRR
jgi:hypothetical protein